MLRAAGAAHAKQVMLATLYPLSVAQKREAPTVASSGRMIPVPAKSNNSMHEGRALFPVTQPRNLQAR